MRYEPLVVETWSGADDRAVRLQTVRLANGGIGLSQTSQPGGIDLTNTTVTVAGRLGQSSASTYKIQNKACTVEAGTEGWISFTPTAAEIDTEGPITCQFYLVTATKVDFSEKFTLLVKTPLLYVAEGD